MLDFITWKQFIAVMAISAFLYYAWILGTAKLKSLRNPERKWKPDPPVTNQETENQFPDEEEPEQDGQEDEKFTQLEKLADEINDTILSSTQNISPDELKSKLKDRIAKYPELNQPAFRTAINNLIDRNVRDFDILFSPEELDLLWT